MILVKSIYSSTLQLQKNKFINPIWVIHQESLEQDSHMMTDTW